MLHGSGSPGGVPLLQVPLELEMGSPYIPGPGDEETWGRCTGHEHDPRTETIEEFWSICVDDEVFDEDEEEGEDPLEDK